VHKVMVVTAQADEVAADGWAAIGPVLDVVDLADGCEAPWEPALPGVAPQDHASHEWRGDPPGGADRIEVTGRVEHK
jgi:hypothetical protein